MYFLKAGFLSPIFRLFEGILCRWKRMGEKGGRGGEGRKSLGLPCPADLAGHVGRFV